MKSLILALALLLAACSSSSHDATAQPTTTTMPSTVQPTTTTTTPTNVTEAALVGTWRPVSIAGYDGPLTDPPLTEAPILRFAANGEWNGNDSCNDFSGSYQLRSAEAFRLVIRVTTSVGCTRNTPSPPTTAVRVELLNGRLTFYARNGSQLAQYERATVTARVLLPSTTMMAGSYTAGRVIVENNSGGLLDANGPHMSLFAVALTASAISLSQKNNCRATGGGEPRGRS